MISASGMSVKADLWIGSIGAINTDADAISNVRLIEFGLAPSDRLTVQFYPTHELVDLIEQRTPQISQQIIDPWRDVLGCVSIDEAAALKITQT
jgi:hypothetical protein